MKNCLASGEENAPNEAGMKDEVWRPRRGRGLAGSVRLARRHLAIRNPTLQALFSTTHQGIGISPVTPFQLTGMAIAFSA
jgi:hypothetical protein